MFTRFLGIALAASFTSTLWAQGVVPDPDLTSGAPADAAETAGAAAAASALQGAAGTVAAIEMTNAELTKAVLALQTQLGEVSKATTEGLSQIMSLKDQMDSLQSQVNEDIERQRQILSAISTMDSTSGNPIPRLSSIMENSEDFRNDVAQAVHDSLRTTGTVTINNETSTYQRIIVNDVEQGLAAGEDLTLTIPVGTLVTQVPGREPRNWTIGAPNYHQSIDIIPESQAHVTMRPIEDSDSVTTYYAPEVTTTYYAPSPTTTYYSPSPTTTTYYAPSSPTTTYYAPATSTYAVPTYIAPRYYPLRPWLNYPRYIW